MKVIALAHNIYVQLSDNPYQSDFANTVSYSAPAPYRIRIIHVRMDIKHSAPYLQNLSSDRMRKLSAHTTFTLITAHGRYGFRNTNSHASGTWFDSREAGETNQSRPFLLEPCATWTHVICEKQRDDGTHTSKQTW
jgi:hypothetical protein